jgi:drug/metabolite transporter (DMT)-like permease
MQRLAMSNGLGEFFSIASAACWAVGVILYRRLGNDLSPMRLNFFKNALVLLMLIPSVLLWQGLSVPNWSWQQWLIVLGSGILGIGIADTLYFHALNRLGAGRMGIIGNLYSPSILALGFVFLHERLTTIQWLGFVLVSAGVMLSSWPKRDVQAVSFHKLWKPIIIGITSVCLMAVSIILIKRVLESEPLLTVTGVRMIGALAFMTLWLLISAPAQLRPGPDLPWARVAIAAFFGQYIAMLLWLAGYKYTSASVAATLNETASVFIVLLAWIVLKERPLKRSLAGMVMTLSGVACMLWAT